MRLIPLLPMLFPALLPALLAAALGLPAAPARADDTLYDRLGGGPGVARIVDGAVAMYLTDPRLRADFDNINPDRLRSRIAALLCQLADGPCTYTGRPMAAAHKGLHVTQAEFIAVVEDLQLAMARAEVPFWTQNRLLARLAPMQRDIVTR